MYELTDTWERANLAGALRIAIAGKPGSCRFVASQNPAYTRAPVGAWLASDGGITFTIAIGGKPGSCRLYGDQSSSARTRSMRCCSCGWAEDCKVKSKTISAKRPLTP